MAGPTSTDRPWTAWPLPSLHASALWSRAMTPAGAGVAEVAGSGGEPASIRIGVLGPLTVTGDGGEVAIPAGTESALLEWLVLHRRRGVSVAATASALWPGTARTDALTSLRDYLSRLRRHLGPSAGSGVTRTPDGRLRLESPGLRVDVDEFEGTRLRALEAVHRTRPSAALGLVHSALAVWRGDPYRWIADTPAGQAEAVRLAELGADAREARCALRLVTGRDPGATADLLALVEQDPLRERSWRLLMSALTVGGRRAEALRAYQRCRQHLAEVGTTPAALTVRLEQVVLSDAPLDLVAMLEDEYPPAVAVSGGGGPERASLVTGWAEVGAGARLMVLAATAGDQDRAIGGLTAEVRADRGQVVDTAGALPGPGDGPLDGLAGAVERALGVAARDAVVDLRRWPGGDGDEPAVVAGRHRALRTLGAVLGAAAGERGALCLVLRHVDRSDPAVMAVARHLVDVLDDAPVLVVVTTGTIDAAVELAHPATFELVPVDQTDTRLDPVGEAFGGTFGSTDLSIW